MLLVDGILPKWVGKLLKSNPDIVNSVIKYAKDNPDKAKELITRFVKIKPKAATANVDALPGL